MEWTPLTNNLWMNCYQKIFFFFNKKFYENESLTTNFPFIFFALKILLKIFNSCNNWDDDFWLNQIDYLSQPTVSFTKYVGYMMECGLELKTTQKKQLKRLHNILIKIYILFYSKSPLVQSTHFTSLIRKTQVYLKWSPLALANKKNKLLWWNDVTSV